jgi:hypothetical protein
MVRQETYQYFSGKIRSWFLNKQNLQGSGGVNLYPILFLVCFKNRNGPKSHMCYSVATGRFQRHSSPNLKACMAIILTTKEL